MSDPVKTTQRPLTVNRDLIAAIVTIFCLAIFAGVVLGVFLLVAQGPKQIDPVMTGLLGTVVTGTISLVTAAVSFWVGVQFGAKAQAEKDQDNDQSR